MRKTYIVYLAAGNSRRFKNQKLLYPINKKTMYQHTLDTLIKLVNHRQDCSLIVVTQYQEIKKQYPDLNVILSPKSQYGISYSIQAGLNSIQEKNSYQIMFVVADQPYLKFETLNQFLDTFQHNDFTLASLKYQTQVGNPTIFYSEYKEGLLALEGDNGGRKIIKRHPSECFYFDVSDPKELWDIDTIEDLIIK